MPQRSDAFSSAACRQTINLNHPYSGQSLARLFPDQLPFLICRRLQLSYRLERSFKLEVGSGLLTNRYVLGIDRQAITPPAWRALLSALQLSQHNPDLISSLEGHFQKSSTVYLGFEQGVAGANLRLYFEYWNAVVQLLQQTPKAEISSWQDSEPPQWAMGTGYKWPASGHHRLIISRYWVRPLLSQAQILDRVDRLLSGDADEQSSLSNIFRGSVLNLLQSVLSSDQSISPVFLEVDEPGTARCSFDLAVHRYQLQLHHLIESLQPLFMCLLGTGVQRGGPLLGSNGGAIVTHVSAGRSRHGLPYACIYYDPHGGTEGGKGVLSTQAR